MKKVKIDKRPWGFEEVFTMNEKTTVKILNIYPKKRNSLQTHKNREEFWYALDNSFKATIGNKIITMKRGDTAFVKKGAKHRYTGLLKPARLLEIGFGKFSKLDIKRLEDDFGRN
tara:strand:+ start:8758 stop:9102 length:345 start_codon:yes stop_codon:yes gene_type:complete